MIIFIYLFIYLNLSINVIFNVEKVIYGLLGSMERSENLAWIPVGAVDKYVVALQKSSTSRSYLVLLLTI